MNTAALNIATSGLQAASTRLRVSADNVANVSSTYGEAYQAKETTQNSLPEGGVRADARVKTPATVNYFQPESFAANEEGVVAFPNVNLEEEVVQQQIADYDFKANLSVIRTQDEMLGNLMDISA